MYVVVTKPTILFLSVRCGRGIASTSRREIVVIEWMKNKGSGIEKFELLAWEVKCKFDATIDAQNNKFKTIKMEKRLFRTYIICITVHRLLQNSKNFANTIGRTTFFFSSHDVNFNFFFIIVRDWFTSVGDKQKSVDTQEKTTIRPFTKLLL